ncbi:hypothetical protein PAHAL_1G078100 [Panicum hallii]|uniref:Uncharacterized protein n=1 Tax=Panicum hallii TaxID=206008 RepID=A0A2T8KUD7_9POAL|nr:hypothetical protein PAHAL_1G078100 [Panicum hallii]
MTTSETLGPSHAAGLLSERQGRFMHAGIAALINARVFLKKRLKKLNSKKGCRFGKIRKMETSRPSNRREVEKYFPGPSRGPLCEKKLFLFAKRPLTRHPGGASRPPNGREVPRRGIPPSQRADVPPPPPHTI